MPSTVQDTDVQQAKLVVRFSLVGMTAFFVFGFLQIASGKTFVGFLELFFGLVAFVNILWFRHSHSIKSTSFRMLLIMMVALLFLLLTGGIGGSGIYWFYTFPALTYFLKGKQSGTRWMIALFLILASIMVLQWFYLLTTPYSLVMLRQFFVSLLAVTMLIYLYQAARERAQEELGKQNLLLTTLLDHLPVGVFVAKIPTGEPIMANQAAIQIVGKAIDPSAGQSQYSQTYNLTKRDGSAYPTDELPLVMTLKQGKTVVKDDICIRHPDGITLTIRATSAPVKDSQGNLLSAVVVFEDVTHEQEVDRMKSEFISLASHQLRTPLTAMKWFSQLLLSGKAGVLTGTQQEYINDIHTSNERMIDLVNSLLNVSRMESGRIMIEPVPTNLGELVQGVVDEVKLKLEEKKQILTVHIPPALPTIAIDPKLVRQVYMNFLTNAIKYTPEKGSIEIRIEKNGETIISKVTDTGYGILPKDYGQVFQKFYRGENIKKITQDGTGLGLYLVKAIVEASGGTVGFESTEGHGSTFWFGLPVSGSIAKKGEVSLS